MKMKRFLTLFLILALTFSVFAGCQSGEKTPDTSEATEAPGPTQSPEEQEVLRVITIGNSHTNDATNLLYEVFHAEMPEQKVLIGNMYYSGCPVIKHVQFAQANSPEYDYMKNDSGTWNTQAGTTLEYALREQAWDAVILHDMNTYAIKDSNYSSPIHQTLIDYVKDHTYYDVDFYWHLVWANPVDPVFFELSYDPQPPGGWVSNYTANSDMNSDKMLTQLIDQTQKHIMSTGEFKDVIPAGTAIQYANNRMDQTDPDLYRDYTHMSDFGRLLCAYTWYATITGKTEITEVNVDVVPANLRHRRAKVLGDLEITEEMKQVIIESVNYALQNPWTVPTQQ